MLETDALFTAAALAAHSNFAREGFRQREVRFLVDLFLNWHGARADRDAVKIHNTQIARYLDALADEGHANRATVRGQPSYSLSRTGVLALAERLVRPRSAFDIDRLLLAYHFLESYRPRLEELIHADGTRFPRELRLDLERLLDSRRLLADAIDAVERELRYLDVRIEEAGSTVKLAEKLLAKGTPFAEVVARVEELYPYELNNQKPLSALFDEVPDGMKRWELTTGNLFRKALIWMPRRKLLAAQLDVLRDLAVTPRP